MKPVWGCVPRLEHFRNRNTTHYLQPPTRAVKLARPMASDADSKPAGTSKKRPKMRNRGRMARLCPPLGTNPRMFEVVRNADRFRRRINGSTASHCRVEATESAIAPWTAAGQCPGTPSTTRKSHHRIVSEARFSAPHRSWLRSVEKSSRLFRIAPSRSVRKYFRYAIHDTNLGASPATAPNTCGCETRCR